MGGRPRGIPPMFIRIHRTTGRATPERRARHRHHDTGSAARGSPCSDPLFAAPDTIFIKSRPAPHVTIWASFVSASPPFLPFVPPSGRIPLASRTCAKPTGQLRTVLRHGPEAFSAVRRKRHSRFSFGASGAATLRPLFFCCNRFRLQSRIHPQVIRLGLGAKEFRSTPAEQTFDVGQL